MSAPQQRYIVEVERAARRALSESLPLDVAVAVVEFIDGDLSVNPHRVGKELNEPLDGIYSARVMREWRLLFTVNEETRTVSILAVRHRADAYRSRP